MANAHSPTRFNGEADNFFDPNFTLDINRKMRVPKSIRVSGDFSDEDIHVPNGNWNQFSSEKYDMHVPDRILVVGQEQHIGTKAPPIEISIENSVMPSEPEPVRCLTPPRILTLDNHYFPTVDEDNDSVKNETMDESIKPKNNYVGNTSIVRHHREQTPGFNLDASLPLAPGEEVQHLRRQVGKLNRRIIAIESEIQQQQQRMKFIYIITGMYICFKTIFWFGKN